MHMTLYVCPDNNISHKVSIRKPNQCETAQLINIAIHEPSPDPTAEFIKISKTCRNISQPPLYYHPNWKVMWLWIYSHLWQAQRHSKYKQGYHHWRLSGPNKWIMAVPSSSYSLEKKKKKILEPLLCKHIRIMVPRHPRAYRPTFQ